MQSKNTILSDQQIASKHIIRNWILILVEAITATIIEEIISIDTTNNNLKWDQHKITWNKCNKNNDEKTHAIETDSLRMSQMRKHLPYGSELPWETWYSIHARSCSLPIWFWASRTIENTCFRIMELISFR